MTKERIIKIAKRRIKTPSTVLGLDCSSTTIGWGLVALNNFNLLAYGNFKPLNNKHPEIERLDNVYNRIVELCVHFEPNVVAIEDIFLFMKGKSHARTITVLTAFNRVAALAAYHIIGDVRFYSVHEIRKIIRHSCLSHSDFAIQKEELPDVIIKHMDANFSVMFNKKGNVAKETFDEADGVAAAWACALHESNKDEVNKLLIKPKKKKKKK